MKQYLKENRRPNQLDINNKTPSRLQTTRLLRVHSPSTSQSPFRCIDNKIAVVNYLPPSTMPKSPTSQITYFKRKKSKQDDMIDETISKLSFLEKKIAHIMEKNDQLRSQLKKTETDSVESYSYYLSGPTRSNKQSNCISQHTLQSYVNSVKNTIHTNHSPIESSRLKDKMIGHHRSSSKTPSVGKFKKSNITIREDVQNGRGRKMYENGFVYDGDWVDGMRHGNGTLKDFNQNIVYQGQWQNDQFSGRGRFINQDYQEDDFKLLNFKQFKLVQHQFTSYEGEFRNGQFHGQGMMTFNCEGEEFKFVGGFALDAFHGVGSLSQDDKIILQGKWIYGCFV
ncbi:unnamed protein product [Paramecium pentaurelia]|uniref:MORN repeat protein n=1 Tax=Paramecium pentaurelia TaxID=43138 RepID=A0A8S1WJC6_9CILI|nr:unnamed protein product [Paramecium pentaurelia]